MGDATAEPALVRYAWDGGTPEGQPLGTTARAGLAHFGRFVRSVGLARVLRERLRLPQQERRSGFTVVQNRLRH